MTKVSAIIIVAIAAIAAAIGIPFIVHHHAYEAGYHAGYQTGRTDEKHAISRQSEALRKEVAMRDGAHTAPPPICVTVAPKDTFSDLTYDLYGDGEPSAYKAAASAVQGLADPSNPDFVMIGQVLAFPVVLTVRGKKLHASFPEAVRRWKDRHVRKAHASTRIFIEPVPSKPQPQSHVIFPVSDAPNINAFVASTAAELPMFVYYASPSQLARPDPPMIHKKTRKRRVLHAIVRVASGVGFIAADGFIMTARTGNPFVGFGIAGGGAAASFLIRRHEKHLEKEIAK